MDLIGTINDKNNQSTYLGHDTPLRLNTDVSTQINITSDTKILIDGRTYTGKDLSELLNLKDQLKKLYPELFLVR
jgi:hypothetical protein